MDFDDKFGQITWSRPSDVFFLIGRETESESKGVVICSCDYGRNTVGYMRVIVIV